MNNTELARIGLAVLWSIACIFTYAGTGSVPQWMLGTMGTCVGWFFISGEKAKSEARKIANWKGQR